MDYFIAPKASFDATADAIRALNGSSDTLTWGQDGFADAIGLKRRWTNEDIAMRNYSGEITLEGTQIRNYAFANSAITGIIGLNVTRLEASAFSRCANLVNVNLPKATASGDGDAVSNFEYCTSLESIILPAYHNMWNYMFRGCTKLKTIVMPALRQLARPNSFGSDTALEKIDIGGKNTSNPNSMAASWVSGCTSLDTFILRYSIQVKLSNISAFTNTPFASDGSGGTLYVPSALISSYEAATNWSTILGYSTNQILPIEGSIYETQYADGTPIGGAS